MLNLKDDRYFVVLKPQVLHNDEMIDVSLKYQLTLQDLKDQLKILCKNSPAYLGLRRVLHPEPLVLEGGEEILPHIDTTELGCVQDV